MAEGTGTGTPTGTETPAVSTATTTPITADQLAAAKPALQTEMLVDKAAASHAAAKLDHAADSGRLQLDAGAAEALIKAVDDARDQVMALWERTKNQLATPLQFGDNPVAHAISARFQDIAVGEDSGAAKALLDLYDVLGDISNALKKNRDETQKADEEAEYQMQKHGGSW
ncbi:hypothetical protein [Lentzea guizhouensis]|uniref:hypothetical protein n=1 Tax=Lentzea guizhouensis TaxID=1586287 RepID=UPI0012B69B41|nr:hypothetical protein [Lentzea guizhouensis]